MSFLQLHTHFRFKNISSPGSRLSFSRLQRRRTFYEEEVEVHKVNKVQFHKSFELLYKCNGIAFDGVTRTQGDPPVFESHLCKGEIKP